MSPQAPPRSVGQLPEGPAVQQNVSARQRVGKLWEYLLLASTLFGILILVLLLATIANDAFGGIATQAEVDLQQLTAGRPLAELSQPELVGILEQNLRSRLLRNLNREQPLAERSTENLVALINAEVVKPEVVAIYPLSEYLFQRDALTAELRAEFPRAELAFKSWFSADFVTSPMSSDPLAAGIRTALLGTLWLLLLTVLLAFPLGIGAALYLEEYSTSKLFDERTPLGRRLNSGIARISGLIQVNIYNLSGVPSIIYGMLGLAIFVRAWEPLSSGALFGASSGGAGTANGRTVFAAALTMALLVLPVVIIASQEAIRAVPSSLRQASYGLGATKWQTVWKMVLPNALPGILTGTILAVSRAIGETAPLIVVGASTFIVTDPSGPFSKFTVLPIQIYNWTSRPQPEFRAIAAAAIVALLLLLLTTNALAITLRNYLRAKRVSQ
jgi:phosphate transport system permease protein